MFLSNQRTPIYLFVLFTLTFSTPFYYLARTRDALVYGQGMVWCPAMAALLTAKLVKRDISTFGWRWPDFGLWLKSYLIPIGYAFAAYLFIWLAGLGGFYDRAFVDQITRRFGFGGLPVATVLILFVILFGTIGMINYMGLALGEEIGWRGFLVPELSRHMSFTKTSLISGVLWSVWHYPLLISGRLSAELVYSLACFTTMVIGMSFALAWLRLRSGSLWTAVLLHSSHNLFISRIFTPLTVDNNKTKYFIDETGAALALAGLVLGAIFWNMNRKHPVIDSHLG